MLPSASSIDTIRMPVQGLHLFPCRLIDSLNQLLELIPQSLLIPPPYKAHRRQEHYCSYPCTFPKGPRSVNIVFRIRADD